MNFRTRSKRWLICSVFAALASTFGLSSLATAAEPGTIQNFTAVPGYGHVFVDHYENNVVDISANLWQTDPMVKRGDHSLSQLWVYGPNNGDYVEIGWTVDPNQFQDNHAPHLFLSAWVNGVWQNYDHDAHYFVYANNPGQVKSGDLVSTGVTAGYRLTFMNGFWWAGYNGVWLGHFPDFWNGGFTSSDRQQVGGEVVHVNWQNNKPLWTDDCTQMGSGNNGTITDPNVTAEVTGFQTGEGDAFHRQDVPRDSVTLYGTDLAYYSGAWDANRSDVSFFYGGSGPASSTCLTDP